MKLSKITILEMLEKQTMDLEKFIDEMNLPYLDRDLREINSPIKLLISWLSDELVEKLNG